MRLRAIVCSRGGHLSNALTWIGSRPSPAMWLLVTDGPEAVALRSRFEHCSILPTAFRWFGKRRVLDPILLCANIWRSLRLALGLRPREVICFGAADTVMFCLFAKALGAEVTFIECMNQVHSPSITGLILYPFCDRFEVQWPELLKKYGPKAICREPLLDPGEREGLPSPSSTSAKKKIFVSVSTGHFEALIRECERLSDHYVFSAQIGCGVFEPSFAFERTLDPQALSQRIAEADIVVTHAGTGLLTAVYRLKKRHIVIPKRKKYGEMNDGQVELAEKWGELGYGRYCANVSDLESALGDLSTP